MNAQLDVLIGAKNNFLIITCLAHYNMRTEALEVQIGVFILLALHST